MLGKGQFKHATGRRARQTLCYHGDRQRREQGVGRNACIVAATRHVTVKACCALVLVGFWESLSASAQKFFLTKGIPKVSSSGLRVGLGVEPIQSSSGEQVCSTLSSTLWPLTAGKRVKTAWQGTIPRQSVTVAGPLWRGSMPLLSFWNPWIISGGIQAPRRV